MVSLIAEIIDQNNGSSYKEGFDSVPPTLVIGKEIDRGSYGVIYLATLDKKLVAVKRFHKVLMNSSGPEENVPLKNFKTECERLKDLNHPNVVRYIETYEDKKGPLLVMELMYESLEKYLKRNKGRLSPERVLEICSSVCEGIVTRFHVFLLRHATYKASLALQYGM